jgi:hypothetical protein
MLILRGPAILSTQVAANFKVELGASIPTVFQRDILGNLLHAVRIRRDNKDGVLHTTKLDIKIQSKIKVYEYGIYIVYTQYVHVCNMYVHVSIEYVQIPVDSFHESGVLAYQMDNIWHA